MIMKNKKILLVVVAFALLFAFSITASAAKTSRIRFYHWLEADEDEGQCNGKALTVASAGLGEWTEKVKLDTDDRKGGCWQKFAIYDPDKRMSGAVFKVNFKKPSGTVGQCESIGSRNIPVNSKGKNMSWSTAYRIDTDERAGWCEQIISMTGNKKYALDVEVTAEDDESQCGDTGIQTVKSGQSATVVLDMDNRDGGCYERFRLKEL